VSFTFPIQILDLKKQLWSAAESGDIDKVQRLIEDHVDVTSENKVAMYMYTCV